MDVSQLLEWLTQTPKRYTGHVKCCKIKQLKYKHSNTVAVSECCVMCSLNFLQCYGLEFDAIACYPEKNIQCERRLRPEPWGIKNIVSNICTFWCGNRNHLDYRTVTDHCLIQMPTYTSQSIIHCLDTYCISFQLISHFSVFVCSFREFASSSL